MSMQNHYTINVAKRVKNTAGREPDRYAHFFATDPRSGTDLLESFRPVIDAIKAAFPSPEYRVTCSHWQASGTNVEI